jgi:hypothetical protein
LKRCAGIRDAVYVKMELLVDAEHCKPALILEHVMCELAPTIIGLDQIVRPASINSIRTGPLKIRVFLAYTCLSITVQLCTKLSSFLTLN